MKLSFRDWRPTHLFGAWVTYWLILAGVTLGKPLLLLSRLRGKDVHGSASAHFDSGVLSAHVDVGGSVWDMNFPLGTMFGWIAGPPLVIWLVYMATRPSQTGFAAAPAPALDAAPVPALESSDRRPEVPIEERQTAGRERVR